MHKQMKMIGLVFMIVIGLMPGCHTPPKIRSGTAAVRGVADAGTPAVLKTDEVVAGFTIPAGSRVTMSRAEATPSAPAIEQMHVDVARDSEFKQSRATFDASTGTVDTSVAKHRIDSEERRWLLWAAIGALLAGFVVRSLLPAWPALSNGLLVSAAIAGVAWKVAMIPDWFLAIGATVAALLALGYKRAEWDANKNWIPDVLEKK